MTSICFTIAWLQWFFIFLIGIHVFGKHNENIAEQTRCSETGDGALVGNRGPVTPGR